MGQAVPEGNAGTAYGRPEAQGGQGQPLLCTSCPRDPLITPSGGAEHTRAGWGGDAMGEYCPGAPQPRVKYRPVAPPTTPPTVLQARIGR